MYSGELTRFGPVLLLALAVACGPAEQPVDPVVEPDIAPEPETTTPARLGGGQATEVHPGQAGSPHVRVEWVVNGADVSITYGRPYLKDRRVGETVEPMDGRVWRLGADEATTLQTDTDLVIGETQVPAGEYTLWILTSDGQWQLIVNEETGQWGTRYDETHDFARIPMQVREVETPAEQLTLIIDNGEFRVEWGRFVASVPLEVRGET